MLQTVEWLFFFPAGNCQKVLIVSVNVFWHPELCFPFNGEKHVGVFSLQLQKDKQHGAISQQKNAFSHNTSLEWKSPHNLIFLLVQMHWWSSQTICFFFLLFTSKSLSNLRSTPLFFVKCVCLQVAKCEHSLLMHLIFTVAGISFQLHLQFESGRESSESASRQKSWRNSAIQGLWKCTHSLAQLIPKRGPCLTN